jgi:hypothetical protein
MKNILADESKETQELFDQVVKMIKDRVAIEAASVDQEAQAFQKTQQPRMLNNQRTGEGELDA